MKHLKAKRRINMLRNGNKNSSLTFGSVPFYTDTFSNSYINGLHLVKIKTGKQSTASLAEMVTNSSRFRFVAFRGPFGRRLSRRHSD